MVVHLGCQPWNFDDLPTVNPELQALTSDDYEVVIDPQKGDLSLET
jgi:hypothetical protein